MTHPLKPLADRLFGREQEPAPEVDPAEGNHAPTEGNHPRPPVDQADMREFTRALFDRARIED